MKRGAWRVSCCVEDEKVSLIIMTIRANDRDSRETGSDDGKAREDDVELTALTGASMKRSGSLSRNKNEG